MWGMIATWRMALEGVTEAAAALASGADTPAPWSMRWRR